MFDAAFSTYSIIKAFVDSGMLDHITHMCPDIIGIINSFKVNWDKVPRSNAWIMNMIPLAILEVYKCGEVTE